MNARPRRAGRILAWILAVVLILAVGAYLAVGAVAANALTLPKRDFAAGVTPAQLGLAYEDVRFAARTARPKSLAGIFRARLRRR